MIKICLIGLLLLVFTSSKSTFVYSFSAAATSTQTKPSFSLGVLNQNDDITFTFTPVNGGGGSGYIINIMNSTNQVLMPAPVTFSTTIPQTVNWKVAVTGTYYIQVTTASFTAMDTFYLVVGKNSVDYLKIVDVKRDAVFKYIYLSGSSNSLTLETTGSTASGVPINLYANALGSSTLTVIGGYTHYFFPPLSRMCP